MSIYFLPLKIQFCDGVYHFKVSLFTDFVDGRIFIIPISSALFMLSLRVHLFDNGTLLIIFHEYYAILLSASICKNIFSTACHIFFYCYSQVRIYNSYMIYNVFIIIFLSIYREEFNLNKIINPINK